MSTRRHDLPFGRFVFSICCATACGSAGAYGAYRLTQYLCTNLPPTVAATFASIAASIAGPIVAFVILFALACRESD